MVKKKHSYRVGPNLYQRPDTKTYEFRKTIKGVKYYESIPEAKNKLQAEMAAAQILRQIYEGKYGKEGGEVGAYDFVKFVKEIYLPSLREHLRQPKEADYQCGVLCSFFQGKRLRDVTLLEVEKFRKARLNGLIPVRVIHNRKRKQKFYKSVKPITAQNSLTALSAILNWAIDNDYAISNPVRRVKWRKGQVKKERSRIPSPTELDLLYGVMQGEIRYAVDLTLNTGIRRGSERMGILGLKVDSVDLHNRALWYIAKGGVEKVVPINDKAAAVLKILIASSTDGYLFRERTGYMISHPRGDFRRYCKEAGIEDLHFHDLRRLFSSRVDKLRGATAARDLLGHSNIRVTNEHYLPENWGAMLEAVDALSRADFNGTFTEKPAKVLKLR